MSDVKESHKENVKSAMAAADSPEGRLRAFLTGQIAAARAVIARFKSSSDTALVHKLIEETDFLEKHHEEIVAGVFSGVE